MSNNNESDYQTNEQMIIEMGEHFKNTITKKNNEIIDLKKKLFTIYGLIRATDDYFDDHNFIELSRLYLSNWIEEILEK